MYFDVISSSFSIMFKVYNIILYYYSHILLYCPKNKIKIKIKYKSSSIL